MGGRLTDRPLVAFPQHALYRGALNDARPVGSRSHENRGDSAVHRLVEVEDRDGGVGRDGDEEDSVLGDFIEDEDTVSPEDSATNQLLKEQVADVLSSLSDREQKIVRMRFGLDNGKSHTLEEVGQEFAVTRERIRQIEAKALAKLRKHKDARKLYEYID